MNNKVTFKPYDMNQLKLPIDLAIDIPENHLVKIVNRAIERMNLTPLLKKYKGGGTSAYHPLMMLKVLVYAYTQKIYTARKIAKALRENIYFMWISGKQTPNFRTINMFRSTIMKDIIDEVFIQVMELLLEEGLVHLQDYFLDGTKIESKANKYTFVWKKVVNKNKLKLETKIRALISQIDYLNEQENSEYGDKDLEEMGENPISSDKIEELAKRINERIKAKESKNSQENTGKTKQKSNKKENEQEKTEKKILRTLEKDFIPRLKKYEEQEELLNGRNSYSKTDCEATFMRMKEDHMLNGQLKPGYNVQIGTENQFILNYSIHQDAGDTGTLPSNIEKFKKMYNKYPQRVIADSGYGSEENYEYLKERDIEGYVKYNYFHKEQKKSFKKEIYRVENLQYDEEKDEYICPKNRRLRYQGTQTDYSKLGYKKTIRKYTCEDCSNCSHKQACTKSHTNRSIQINRNQNKLRAEARARLLSEEGVRLRKKRCIEPESVFGQIKWNNGFKRFLMGGLDKVNLEFGLIAIAHNFRKWALA